MTARMASYATAPTVLTGFEHINRYWDPLTQHWSAKILPGELYVSQHPQELISTTLGSCVSACIWDSQTGIGGMNHFMLPLMPNKSSSWLNHSAGRYGLHAMEFLINAILQAGGDRRFLQMKVCGGANLFAAKHNEIGQRNAEFVLKFAQQDGIPVVAQDLGQTFPRKVQFFPATGQLRIKALKQLDNPTVIDRERQYQASLAMTATTGSVELFE